MAHRANPGFGCVHCPAASARPHFPPKSPWMVLQQNVSMRHVSVNSFPLHPRGYVSSQFYQHDTTETFLPSGEPQLGPPFQQGLDLHPEWWGPSLGTLFQLSFNFFLIWSMNSSWIFMSSLCRGLANLPMVLILGHVLLKLGFELIFFMFLFTSYTNPLLEWKNIIKVSLVKLLCNFSLWIVPRVIHQIMLIFPEYLQ